MAQNSQTAQKPKVKVSRIGKTPITIPAESDCRYYLNPQFFPRGYNASVFS